MVHAAMQCVMYDLDPEGLEARSVGAKKRKPEGPKGHFTTTGPNFVYSVDGHDKLYDVMRKCLTLASPPLFHSRLEVFPLGSHFADYRFTSPLSFIQSHLCTACWDTMAVIGLDILILFCFSINLKFRRALNLLLLSIYLYFNLVSNL